jgi:Lon protease-like protein
MIQQLPLFPLGTTLFPGAALNLHIFEERYRAMIGRCLEQKSPFGVILLRSGEEVEEGRPQARPAQIYEVGTVAQINANVRLEDGRYLLTATGERRFRVQYLLQRAPYLVASVVELAEQSGPDVEAAARDLRSIYARYWQAIAAATGTSAEGEDLPGSPEAMANQLAERLQVPHVRKQRWLEAELPARLRALASELRGELAILPAPGKRKGGPDQGDLGSLN